MILYKRPPKSQHNCLHIVSKIDKMEAQRHSTTMHEHSDRYLRKFFDISNALLTLDNPGVTKADLLDLLKQQEDATHAVYRFHTTRGVGVENTRATEEELVMCRVTLERLRRKIVRKLKLLSQPTEQSAEKALEVFGIQELAEMTLLHLDTFNLFQIIQTRKTFESAVTSPGASSKLHVKLGLQPDEWSHFHTPFAEPKRLSQSHDEPHPPSLADFIYCKLVNTGKAVNRAHKTGQITIRAMIDGDYQWSTRT